MGSFSANVKLGFWALSPGSESIESRDDTPEPGLENHQHLQVTQRRRAAKEIESEQLRRQQKNSQGWARGENVQKAGG